MSANSLKVQSTHFISVEYNGARPAAREPGALRVSSDQVGMALRMTAAMKYYEMGSLSSGAAARLAGVPRTVFWARLADYGIGTFQLTEEQLQREVRLA